MAAQRLRHPCEHDRYDEHVEVVECLAEPKTSPHRYPCPGGEFLPEDALVIEKVDGLWPSGLRWWWDLFDLLVTMQHNEAALREDA